MNTPSIRGYVWIFCMYLAVSIFNLAHLHHGLIPQHRERDWYHDFNEVICPLVVAFLPVSMLNGFQNKLDRCVLVFTSLCFLSETLFNLHHLEYISFTTPRFLADIFWLSATIFLGYRTDQILKHSNSQSETSSCSTHS